MGEESGATLEGQFFEFARMTDTSRDGSTITLFRSDYWLRQAKILDDRKVTMVDTGIAFNQYNHTEITFDEWLEHVREVCEKTNTDFDKTIESLTNCGLPGHTVVNVPQYRDHFENYVPKNKWPRQQFCNATYDGYLCWPATAARTTVVQNCPNVPFSDTTCFAYRMCGPNGRWLDRRGEESDDGWTNFTKCFPSDVLQYIRLLFHDDENVLTNNKLKIILWTRRIELVGFTIAFFALLTSLLIFKRFRSLHNNRTKIHINLFTAMILQVLIRLAIYIDQAITSSPNTGYYDNEFKGINNIPYVCEFTYLLLENSNTAMFMWMFIEGLRLHNIVTGARMVDSVSQVTNCLIGWGTPVIFTAIWGTFTAIDYQNKPLKSCWFGYNFSSLYWIVQGPRLAVIVINMIFLLKIMRVLIIKLRKTRTTQLLKIRKAVRAALVLLPLLGITNVVTMFDPPLESSAFWFAFVSFSTHLLRSFQGVFIALIYCFMNAEVRAALRKFYIDNMAMRMDPNGNHSTFGRILRFVVMRYLAPANNNDIVAAIPIELAPNAPTRRNLNIGDPRTVTVDIETTEMQNMVIIRMPEENGREYEEITPPQPATIGSDSNSDNTTSPSNGIRSEGEEANHSSSVHHVVVIHI